MIVKAEGPNGRAKINSDGPKHALGLVQYLLSIGYEAWIEDADGNEHGPRMSAYYLVTFTDGNVPLPVTR